MQYKQILVDLKLIHKLLLSEHDCIEKLNVGDLPQKRFNKYERILKVNVTQQNVNGTAHPERLKSELIFSILATVNIGPVVDQTHCLALKFEYDFSLPRR